MKILYKDKNTDKSVEKDYPGSDISVPIIGLDKDVKLYFIENETIENPNPNKYNLVPKPDELIDEPHIVHSHLFICKRGFRLVEKSTEEIVQRLKDDLGKYLDTTYPLWERNKHNAEGSEIILSVIQNIVTKEQLDRKDYLQKMLDWVTECRNLRQQKEQHYLISNIFPEFGNYPARPE